MGFDPGRQAADHAARQAQEAARRSAEIARQNAERGAELSRRSQWDSMSRQRSGRAPSRMTQQQMDPRYIERYEGERGGSHLFGRLFRLILLIAILAAAYYILFSPDVNAWSGICHIQGNPICGTTP